VSLLLCVLWIGDVCIADLLVVVLLPQISSDPPAERAKSAASPGALVALAMPGATITSRLIDRAVCNQRDGFGLAAECVCWYFSFSRSDIE